MMSGSTAGFSLNQPSTPNNAINKCQKRDWDEVSGVLALGPLHSSGSLPLGRRIRKERNDIGLVLVVFSAGVHDIHRGLYTACPGRQLRDEEWLSLFQRSSWGSLACSEAWYL